MKFGKIDKNTYVDLLLKTNLNLNKKKIKLNELRQILEDALHT